MLQVCVSLLGTWSGKGVEVWSPASSNLLQVIISIQGLILVPEPYYNEAGYLKQRGTTEALENSRLYNEMAVLKLIQSMAKMTLSPPETFRHEIIAHFSEYGGQIVRRNEYWLELAETYHARENPALTIEDIAREFNGEVFSLPEFPFFPPSIGLCKSLRKANTVLVDVLASLKDEEHQQK